MGTALLSIEDLRKLPQCGRSDAGVYFLWEGDELVYVGLSKNIHNRLVRHRHIHFTKHTCLVIECEPEMVKYVRLITGPIEDAYIARYSPRHNVMGTAAWNAARKWS